MSTLERQDKTRQDKTRQGSANRGVRPRAVAMYAEENCKRSTTFEQQARRVALAG